ncbi:acyltransferase family protein [[Clostridium] dakarense]|uniref:acyltransferase family protein n=1 Tax=Faecalimicrobium dakarense TaxID=1301100 RepID=UPI0004B91464|nr:acyltransferase family protein [[Clostridium] dakarense]
MTLLYIIIFMIISYKAKIYDTHEYNTDALSKHMCNSIKGIAAISVVLHHISQRLSYVKFLEPFRYVGYLAVALFFFYSGYGMMKSFESKANYLKNFWTKRIPKVVLPFIFANILFVIVYSFFNKAVYSPKDTVYFILGIKLIDGFKWYILAIITFYIGFYFSFKYLKGNKSMVGMFLVITGYCYVNHKLGNGEWWYNSVYCFLMGLLYGRYSEIIINFIKKRYLTVLLVLSVLFSIYHEDAIFNLGIVTTNLAAIFFVVLCVCICMKFSIGNEITIFLGSISYEIYLMHRIFLDAFSNRITNPYVYLVVCLIGSILLGYLFNKFMDKIFSINIKKINKNKHNKRKCATI